MPSRLIVCAILLSLALVPAAHAAGPDPLPGSLFQGADGDQAAAPGLVDWATLQAAGAVTYAPDDNVADTAFVGGTKELDPGQWSFDTSAGGVTPDKSNIRAAWYSTEHTAAGNFLYFAFQREATTGATFLGFELNQLATTFVNDVGAVVPCRITGDALLSYEVDPSEAAGVVVVLYRWTATVTDPVSGCSESGVFDLGTPIAATDGQGHINYQGDISNVLPGAPATLTDGQFGEGAVNFTRVMGDSCTRYVQIQLHSRTSASISSALVDFVSPVPVDVGGCAIEVDKTGPSLAHHGEQVTFTYDVTNPGSKPLSSVTLSDDRCSPMSARTGDTDGDNVLDLTETWRYTCTRVLPAHASPDLDPFVNTATVSGSYAGETVSDVDVHSTDIAHPGIAVDKRGPGSGHVGETLAFTIDVVNTGDVPVGVAVSDPRCDAGTLSAPSGDTDGDSRLDLTETWTYTCTHVLTAADADPFVNTATVTATDAAGGTTTGSDAVSVDVLHPRIAMDKRVRVAGSGAAFADGPLGVVEGAELEYQLRVANTGDVALGSVAIADARCDAGTLTGPAGDTGADGSLAPGEVWTYTCRHQLVAGDADPFVNTATVSAEDPAGAPASSGDSVTADVLHPAIALRKRVIDPESGALSDGPVAARPGQVLRYDIEVTNPGDAPLTVTLSDPGCDTGTMNGPDGDADGDQRLDVTETWVFRCSHRLVAADGVQFTNVATATGTDAAGQNESATDSVRADVVLTPQSDLSIVKSAPAEVGPGAAIPYTLTVANAGPSDATGVVVRDVLPEGTTLASATPTQGTCAAAGATVECALGDLPAGASAQVVLVVSTAESLAGRAVVNTATVTGNQEDPDPSDGSSTVTVRVGVPPVPPADLVIDKALVGGSGRVGDELTYQLTVVNDGPGTATGIELVDTLSSAVRFVSATTAHGTCSGAPVLRCALGTLAAGESAVVTLRVVPLRAGTLVNSATVTANEPDPRLPNIATSTATIKAPPTRSSLSKRVARRTVDPGATVGYTITYRNLGPGTARGVTICDRLPGRLTLVSAPGGRLDGGSVCWRRARVAAGATVRLRLRARVDADAPAGRIRNIATVEGTNALPRRTTRTVGVRPRRGALPNISGGVTG